MADLLWQKLIDLKLDRAALIATFQNARVFDQSQNQLNWQEAVQKERRRLSGLVPHSIPAVNPYSDIPKPAVPEVLGVADLLTALLSLVDRTSFDRMEPQ